MIKNVVETKNDYIGEKHYYFKHKTGLEVYVFPKELTTSYAIFATRYGAIDNKFKLSTDKEFTTVPDGIAHFLEHKLFECEDGSDAFELFAKTGASANAFTSNTLTAYLFSATDNFYESLEILLDFVTHPYFSEETVQKEQGIIGQELRMYEDHPGSRLNKELLKALYKKNKVRIDVGGTIESIAEINADILYKCYNTFYNLNNMTLVVCGNLDVDKVSEICDKILKVAEPIEIIRDYECEDEPKEVNKKRAYCQLDVSKPIFAIGVKNNDISTDSRERTKKGYGAEILIEMLFSQSSSFFNELYDEGLIASELGYSFDITKHYSFFSLSSESKYPEKVYDRFVEYIEKMKKQGLDKESFDLSKKTILSSCIKSYDSTEEIGESMIFNIFDGFDSLGASEIINSITLEYVSEILKEGFVEDYYTMAVVEPIKAKKKK